MNKTLEVLTDPDSFFAKKIKEEIDFKPPLLIIGLIMILGAIAGYISVSTIMSTMASNSPNMGAAYSFGIVGSIIGAILSAILGWLIISGIFHLISSIFGGNGQFSRVLEFTAYGFLPSVFGSVIGIILTYLLFNSIDMTSMSNPENISQLIIKNPYSIASSLVGLVFTVWSANIWIHGIKYARNLTFSNALKTVGIPVVIYLLVQLISLIMAFV